MRRCRAGIWRRTRNSYARHRKERASLAERHVTDHARATSAVARRVAGARRHAGQHLGMEVRHLSQHAWLSVRHASEHVGFDRRHAMELIAQAASAKGQADAEREHPLNEPCDGRHPPRVLGPHAGRHATGEWDGSLAVEPALSDCAGERSFQPRVSDSIPRDPLMNPFARWAQATTTARPQHIATRRGYFAAKRPAGTSHRRISATTYGPFSPRSKRAYAPSTN